MMLEVCRYSDTSSVTQHTDDFMMKHSANNVEVFEFNLGQAPQLRCVNTDKSTTCTECETCKLTVKLRDIKQWFPRLGDHSRKRFMLGLMQRTHSAELLNQVVKLLQPVLCKDFTYSRSRTNPSLATDTSTLSSDRALQQKDVENYIVSTWYWFGDANYWSKSNFALVLLQMCDAHLLYTVGVQARTLLISEVKAAQEFEDANYTEHESIASTTYTYNTDDHPQLDLLSTASKQYGQDKLNPFTGKEFPYDLGDLIENDAGDDDFTECTSQSSLDPAYMVIPTSAKAYAGVSKYRDMVRQLPVHISKMILSMLDTAALRNALCVSTYWRILVEEVHRDFYVNQQLWEEVMLMQGASAQGANPVYAKDVDVLVPNLDHRTGQVIKTNNAVIKTMFKSEVSFDTALSGVMTRKVIMEERNVYCGPYNVLVLCDQVDVHRVFHTDGGNLITIGSKDRKVRFIDNTSGHEHKRMTKGESADGELPIITGHAGSIRCVHIIESKGLVLSGSYDTSIRMWSVKTGHCLKIFRGHRDTVLTMKVLGDLLISGSKDKSCKIWNMQTGKCQRSFRHRYPVTAIAISTETVISGCDGGKVKVWDLRSGNLIKVLNGHHEGVTAIQFDRWHIVTGGRDGYALVWSAMGDHNRCLSALRHPKEVLCLEFMYLRCITGSADGRIRIWNIITGQCCRIMRGNSRSDPILNIIALDNRITINTAVNLLVLNFEEVEWNYNLEEDKVPPLVQYSSYSDAPVRQQPYPYIRAQRMKKAGATNSKILSGKPGLLRANTVTSKPPMSQLSYSAPQLPHSAKTLSARSLGSARIIQHPPERPYMSAKETRAIKSASYDAREISAKSKPPIPGSAKPRPATSKSAVSAAHTVTIMEEAMEQEMEQEWREPLKIKRRTSWAFENPIVPKSKDITLSETKALLRSQMRMKSETVVPPDFIYLTVNAIQNSMTPNETSANTDSNVIDSKMVKLNTRLRQNRPSSSPSKIDPRSRLPVDEIDTTMWKDIPDSDTLSEVSDARSIKTTKSRDSLPVTADKEIYSTKCQVRQIKTAPKLSLHPKRIRTTLPKGRLIRPISASVARKDTENEEKTKKERPITAPTLRIRPDTANSIPSQIAASLPGVQPQRRRQQQHVSTTGYEASLVPMLMYPPDMKEKLAAILKERRQQRHDDQLESASEIDIGKVSQFNDPMRSHVKFELRTHNQEKDFITDTEKQHVVRQQREDAMLERKKRVLWTAKAKGKDLQDIARIKSAPAAID